METAYDHWLTTPPDDDFGICPECGCSQEDCEEFGVDEWECPECGNVFSWDEAHPDMSDYYVEEE